MVSVIKVALGPSKSAGRSSISGKRDFEVTFNLGLETPRFERTQLEPDPEVQLHVNMEHPVGPLLVIVGKLVGIEHHHLLTLEQSSQRGGVLVALVERGQLLGIEPGVLVDGPGLDAVVVDADPLVGVAYGDVDHEVVVEGAVVVGEVELREGSVVDVELDLVGAEDEPEDQGGEADDEEDGEDELEDEAEEAATAAAAATTAASVAVVGSLLGWWD